jgi:hypothetical protein
VQNNPKTAKLIMNYGLWIMDYGLWIMDYGLLPSASADGLEIKIRNQKLTINN